MSPTDMPAPGSATPPSLPGIVTVRAGWVTIAVGAIGLLLAVVMVFAAINYLQGKRVAPLPIDMPVETQACRSEMVNTIDTKQLTPAVWGQVGDLCYMRIRGNALLADFNIRRSNLIEQQVEGRIVLWMVVAITLSGVALAGLQLLAAYKLAGTGHGTFADQQEIVLKQNEISLKSSVTGLMILIVSFAFFMVYVAWVYTSKELKQENPESASNAAAAPSSTGSGGYGQAPTGTTIPAPASPVTGGYGPPPTANKPVDSNPKP